MSGWWRGEEAEVMCKLGRAGEESLTEVQRMWNEWPREGQMKTMATTKGVEFLQLNEE